MPLILDRLSINNRLHHLVAIEYSFDECEIIYFAITSIASIRSYVVGKLYIIVTSDIPGISCLTTQKQFMELLSARNGQKKQFQKLFLKELARKQLQNLLTKRQGLLVFGGLAQLSRLSEVDNETLVNLTIDFASHLLVTKIINSSKPSK